MVDALESRSDEQLSRSSQPASAGSAADSHRIWYCSRLPPRFTRQPHLFPGTRHTERRFIVSSVSKKEVAAAVQAVQATATSMGQSVRIAKLCCSRTSAKRSGAVEIDVHGTATSTTSLASSAIVDAPRTLPRRCQSNIVNREEKQKKTESVFISLPPSGNFVCTHPSKLPGKYVPTEAPQDPHDGPKRGCPMSDATARCGYLRKGAGALLLDVTTRVTTTAPSLGPCQAEPKPGRRGRRMADVMADQGSSNRQTDTAGRTHASKLLPRRPSRPSLHVP